MRTREGYWAAPWTADEITYLRDGYHSMPVKEIADHLGRSYNAVVLRARIEGLKSRHRAASTSLTVDYFSDIDTPVKAYLLGLITADGNISDRGQLALALSEKDAGLVELARDAIAPGGRITSYMTKEGRRMVAFKVQSADLAADLAVHGVIPRKSLITVWPARIPEQLESAYVCGYFDGDGSLGRTPIPRWAVVSGNMEFLQSMQDRIEYHTGVRPGGPYRDRRHDAAWSIVQTGDPVRAIDAWIHRDVPGLDRKRFN